MYGLFAPIPVWHTQISCIILLFSFWGFYGRHISNAPRVGKKTRSAKRYSTRSRSGWNTTDKYWSCAEESKEKSWLWKTCSVLMPGLGHVMDDTVHLWSENQLREYVNLQGIPHSNDISSIWSFLEALSGPLTVLVSSTYNVTRSYYESFADPCDCQIIRPVLYWMLMYE